MKTSSPITKQSTTLSQKLLLVIAGLIICATLLEIGLRTAGYIIRTAKDYDNMVKIRKTGCYRILCLGESTTASDCIGSYPSSLQNILNQSKMKIEFVVINQGMTGINSSYIAGHIQYFLRKYNPHLVITMMGINDRAPYEFDQDSESTFPKNNFLSFFKIYKLYRLLKLHAACTIAGAGVTTKVADAPGIVSNAEVLKRDKQQDDYTDHQNQLLKKWQNAVRVNPYDGKAYFELGRLHCGEPAVAEALFKKAIQLNPKDAWSYVELGETYARQGAYSLVMEMCDKAFALGSDDSSMYAQIGMYYKAAKEFDKSQKAFEKAVALGSREYIVYNELGGIYLSQNKLSIAEKMFKEAIRANPYMGSNYDNLILLYKRTGQIDLARFYSTRKDYAMKNYYCSLTRSNYQKLKASVESKNLTLVCMQYPTLSVYPLRRLLGDPVRNVFFVDNEQLFKRAVQRNGYDRYFLDNFGGSFGHCTNEGNKLLAENIAKVILQEVFHR